MTIQDAIKFFEEGKGTGYKDIDEICLQALKFTFINKTGLEVKHSEPLKEDVKIGHLTVRKGTSILSKCPLCERWVKKTQKHCDQCGIKLIWESEQ